MSIHSAVKNGDIEAVKYILRQDPNAVHEVDREGWQPVHCASYYGHVDMVSLLLNHGCEVDAQEYVDDCTPLDLASMEGHAVVVGLLLDKMADVTIPDRRGRTPLMQASFWGHVDVLQRLFHHHVPSPLDTKDENRATALWWGCCYGRKDIVKCLLHQGADPFVADDDGALPMDIARLKGHAEIITLLLEWERSYTLFKVRRLVDAAREINTPLHFGVLAMGTPWAEIEKARENAAPHWLKGRVEKGEALPVVEVVERGEGIEGVHGLTLEYVMREMTAELFVELMEMMGTTGCNK